MKTRSFISVFLPLTALKLLTVATAMLNNFALLETKIRILNSPIFHVPRVYIVLLVLFCSSGLHSQTHSDKPNIVWLVSEDNSKHYLKLYNEGGAPMPNVEALAQKGVVFNNAFSNAPVCSVARSTIISGCYAQGSVHNIIAEWSLHLCPTA